MRTTVLFLLMIFIGCSVNTRSNGEYYKLSSGLGWKPSVTPEQLNNYVAWHEVIDIILAKPESIEAVGQGHSLQVNIIFKNQKYIQTIEPDIDTIFMVLEKCGKPCSHISQITE